VPDLDADERRGLRPHVREVDVVEDDIGEAGPVKPAAAEVDALEARLAEGERPQVELAQLGTDDVQLGDEATGLLELPAPRRALDEARGEVRPPRRLWARRQARAAAGLESGGSGGARRRARSWRRRRAPAGSGPARG